MAPRIWSHAISIFIHRATTVIGSSARCPRFQVVLFPVESPAPPADISFECAHVVINAAAGLPLHRQSFFFVPNTCICGKENVALDGSEAFQLRDRLVVCRPCSHRQHYCHPCRRQQKRGKTVLTKTGLRSVFESFRLASTNGVGSAAAKASLLIACGNLGRSPGDRKGARPAVHDMQWCRTELCTGASLALLTAAKASETLEDRAHQERCLMW